MKIIYGDRQSRKTTDIIKIASMTKSIIIVRDITSKEIMAYKLEQSAIDISHRANSVVVTINEIIDEMLKYMIDKESVNIETYEYILIDELDEVLSVLFSNYMEKTNTSSLIASLTRFDHDGNGKNINRVNSVDLRRIEYVSDEI